jgi:SAM-dependent methyltransferase
MIDPILKITSHPFFLGPVPVGSNLELPTRLPFELGIHPKYAMPVLILTDEIRHALAAAYSLGSMLSTPLGESFLSNERMSEVLGRLLSIYDGNVEKVKFLEIGCGSGALLNELKVRGAEVMGVEIGPQGQEGARKYGIKVIDKPLESAAITERFDCIYSYACLEHIVELDKFFAASRKCLKENGLFFHVVPYSELQFSVGYIDHLVHEHVNYFTTQNGVRLFELQGFRSGQACTSSAGNELYLWGYYDSSALPVWPGDDIRLVQAESRKLKEYSDKITERTERIITALKNMDSIGFYAGGFEYSYYLKEVGNVRYFDGDSFKQGQSWLFGLPAIESPEVLRANPLDDLIVCKDHYFDAILQFLSREIRIPSSIRVHKLGDLGV